ncbi:flagellin, partial [Campylobacter jejuni]
SSVSLRESKGQINANIADSMGFNATQGGKFIVSGTGAAGSIADWMSSAGSGFSAGSGYSAGQAAAYSKLLEGNIAVISAAGAISSLYNVSAGSGFSAGSNNSQFATMKTSTGNALGVKDETAG